MKKIIISILTFFSVISFYHLDAQDLLGCSPLKFSGVAPSPWAIDGQTTDWQTLTGPYSGDPVFPFNLSNKTNTAYDAFGQADFDKPSPEIDLRVLSIIHDDHNVFFYFRKLTVDNFQNKAFYFFDTNLDGKINQGEPVIAIQFNDKKVTKLSMGIYIPLNAGGDAIAGPPVCNVDGNPLPGTVELQFNSHNVDLLPGEVFAAAVTENGYGIEVAVPWRLISDYKYFAYRLALQRGGGTYNPLEPSDNASGCGLRPDLIGEADFAVINSSVTTITPGQTYRITLTFQNLTPGTIVIDPADSVRINNIVQNDGLPVSETQFAVKVGSVSYEYAGGTFDQQPIIYSTLPPNLTFNQLRLAPFATGSVSIEISFPPNGSVLSASIEITPKSRTIYYLLIDCPLSSVGGGGKPINPVGFDLGLEEPSTSGTKTIIPEIEGINKNEKVKVYPNPSTGSANVVLPDSGPFDIVLTDYTGKTVRKWNNITQRILKVDNLKPGFYLLNVQSGNRKISVTKKIVIN